jgi:hypothetical protein
MQQLTTQPLNGPDGKPFTVAFNQGLPPAGSGPCLFILDDGSIHSGAIVQNSKTFKNGALSTTLTAGSTFEQFEIPLHRVVGYADAGAQYRHRSGSSWLCTPSPETTDRKHIWDPDPILDREVFEALTLYKRVPARARRHTLWHRFLCWSGNRGALQHEKTLSDAIAHVRTVIGRSEEHEQALERLWRVTRDSDASDLMGILANNNGW